MLTSQKCSICGKKAFPIYLLNSDSYVCIPCLRKLQQNCERGEHIWEIYDDDFRYEYCIYCGIEQERGWR